MVIKINPSIIKINKFEIKLKIKILYTKKFLITHFSLSNFNIFFFIVRSYGTEGRKGGGDEEKPATNQIYE